MSYPKKIVVGITGASGVHLGVEFVRHLPSVCSYKQWCKACAY